MNTIKPVTILLASPILYHTDYGIINIPSAIIFLLIHFIFLFSFTRVHSFGFDVLYVSVRIFVYFSLLRCCFSCSRGLINVNS